MKMQLLFYYIMSFLSGLISLCLSLKHIMMSLLSVELMILSLFCFSPFLLSMMLMDL